MNNDSFSIDIGGTRIKYGFVNKDTVINYHELPTPIDKDKLLEVISQLITLNAADLPVHISIASQVKNGIVLNPPNLPLQNFNLESYIKKITKKEVFIQNDVNCAALAEHEYGIKKDNFVVLSLGTGIGGGIFISGRLYSGKGSAGELGHMMIEGRYLEDLWKLARMEIKRKNKWKLMTLNELISSTDSKFIAIKKNLLDVLAQAIETIINSFNPECIVLSGGVKYGGSLFISALEVSLAKYSFIKDKTPLAWTTLDYPELIGAALLSKD